jgi:hypothetical protein
MVLLHHFHSRFRYLGDKNQDLEFVHDAHL